MEHGHYPIRIPDILSLSRMVLSIPLFMAIIMFCDGAVSSMVPVILLAVMIVTDVADGRLARWMGVTSHRGMVLDSASDVTMAVSSSAALAVSGLIPSILPVVTAVFGIVFIMRVTILTSFRGGYDPLGRVCGILSMCLPILILFPEDVRVGAMTSISFILASLMVVSMLFGTFIPLLRHRDVVGW